MDLINIMNMLPFIVAAVVSFLLVPVSMWLAGRFGMLDKPDARKIHRIPTPRLGGIAIYIGLLLGVIAAFGYGKFSGHAMSSDMVVKGFVVLAASAFVFAIGVIDDIRSVSSRYKLIALLAASAMVCGSGVIAGGFVFGGQSYQQFHFVGWLLTIGWLVGVAVAINFIDGLDGLAGSVTLLSSVTLCCFLLIGGQAYAAVLPLALSGALVGFLFFNWHPAKTFMGDGGALTIGFLLAASMVLANQEVGTMRGIVVPTLAISIPLLDTLLTVFRRRYQQRRSVFSAERGHVHHRLLDRGFSHKHAVISLVAVSFIAVCIGLISLTFEGWGTLGGLSLMIPLLWGTFQFAGSVRTDEMVSAIRKKRDQDRTANHYRATFEDLQLEFSHVATFSQWWDGVCLACERLDFTHAKLVMPSQRGAVKKSDSTENANAEARRELNWETERQGLLLENRIQATIPVDFQSENDATALITIDIAVNKNLESASNRLGLFSRLMTEYSLMLVRRKNDRKRLESAQHHRPTAAPFDQQQASSTDDGGALGHLRVALVHDFFYTYCGAERVVEQIINVFPGCDVFSLFDFLPEDQRGFLQGKSVSTSFIQKLPFAKTKHRAYLPLMPLAIEQLDVSEYDVVISSSYVAAKGVITGPDQLHICYCHSPVRYAWDLQHQYLHQAKLGFSPKGILARAILHYLRNWDARTALGVDHFIANSKFVARRINKVYRRDAAVIYPPVDTTGFELNEQPREDFYLVAGRMVPYKRTDMLVQAFEHMPDRNLVIIGEGPDFEKVKELAGPNVTLLGFQDAEVLVDHMRRAKALLFAAEEDFGIVPVESLACGTPVIAYGKGGVTESVVDGVHGVLYEEQTPRSLIDAIKRFESQQEFGKFAPQKLRERAEKFSNAAFAESISTKVQQWVGHRWPKADAPTPEASIEQLRDSHARTELGEGEELASQQ